LLLPLLKEVTDLAITLGLGKLLLRSIFFLLDIEMLLWVPTRLTSSSFTDLYKSRLKGERDEGAEAESK
jgi:hypothetical protein